MNSAGTYELSDNINNYKMLVIEHLYAPDQNNKQFIYIPKERYAEDDNKKFMVHHGNGSVSCYSNFYLQQNKIIIADYGNENITHVIGIN